MENLSRMSIFIVIFSRMNFFTRPPFNPWDLLPSMPLYCPCHLQLLLFNISLLEIGSQTGADFMEGGVPTTTATEGTSLLLPGLIFTASMDLLAMMGGSAIGSKTEGTHNRLIHVANYAKFSVIPPLIVLSFRTLDMKSSLVRIWH